MAIHSEAPSEQRRRGKHPAPTVVRIEEFPNSPPAPLYLELRACGLAAIAGHGPNRPYQRMY